MKKINDFIEVHSQVNDGKIICLNVNDITAVGTYEDNKHTVTTILIIKGWDKGTLPVNETYTEVMKKMFGEGYRQ